MKRSKKTVLFIAVLVVLVSFLAGGPEYGFADWQKESRIIGEAFKVIEKNYIRPIDLTKCRYDILKALSGRQSHSAKADQENSEADVSPEQESVCLDEFSGYMTPEEYKALMEESVGHFGGIGVEVKQRKDGRVVIVSSTDGSPASGAGIKQGDIIVKVRQESDDKAADIKDISDAVKLIKGPKGTKVFLTIERDGVLIDLPAITREDIKIKTVEYADVANDIGYIHIKMFNAETADDLEAALRGFNKFGANPKVILDLRENPGGILDSVLETLYYFSDKPDDVMLTIKFRRKENVFNIKNSSFGQFIDLETKQPKTAGEFKDYRIVVLVNKFSASAAEIFSGTMKDWGFTIVGSKTFGKGVGQSIYFFSDGSGMRLTTFEYLVGNAKTPVHKKGVLPNVSVEDSRKSREDTLTDKDDQFRAALQVISSK